MTNFAKTALKLPVSDSEFLWALIIDMAKTIDLVMANIPADELKETPDVNARD